MPSVNKEMNDRSLKFILQTWVDGHQPTPAQLETLTAIALTDESYALAWKITPENAADVIQARSQQFCQVYAAVHQLCCDRWGWSPCPLTLLWRLWLPLALQVVDWRRSLNRPLIQGIVGGQGTGKSTLAAILVVILRALGHRVCTLSLDDLYKTYADRLQLQQFDPRLRWRGPPGTHDVELGKTVLQQLKQFSSIPVQLPRFDKSAYGGAGDRTTSETVTNIDIVLFEGWFVGVRPIDSALFAMAPAPIETEHDRQFAMACNERLKTYLPLWDELDRLIVLSPSDYRLSQQWRRESEQKMKATGRSGMTDAEIDEFVLYFWRSLHPELFIKPLLESDSWVDLVIEIQPDHSVGRIGK